MITVQGPILRGDGSFFIGRAKFAPLWAPAAIGGAPVMNATTIVNCAMPDGGFVVVRPAGIDVAPGTAADELTLNAGVWRVSFPSAPEVDAIFLTVPDGVDTIPFADLMAPATADEEGLSDPSSGNGSPEGVVMAGFGRTYWDLLNKVFWIKDSVGGNTGWRELIA